MLNKILLGLSIVVLPVIGTCQSALSNNSTFTERLMLNELEKDARNPKSAASEIEGSPFLNEEFQEGEVITSRGKFNPVNLRYNIYEDAMEFNMGGKSLYMDPTELIQSITLAGQKYVVGDFPFKSNIVRGFLIELNSGDIRLYAKKNISYREGTPPKALESAAHPPKLVNLADTYFIDKPSMEMSKVSGIKDIIESIPEKAEDLKRYAKQEKLSNKKEEDMVKLIQYANSI
jgi:hypothetical protein